MLVAYVNVALRCLRHRQRPSSCKQHMGAGYGVFKLGCMLTQACLRYHKTSVSTTATFNNSAMRSQGRLPVRPLAGQAAPPAPIMVKYFAKGYGKTQIGKLVILTEDQQWTYIIKGEQPTYIPPDKTEMSIHFDNQIDPEMDARLQSPASRISKSFLVRNMMATKSSRQPLS